MNSNNDISIRVASVLKIFEFGAIILLLGAVIGNLMDIYPTNTLNIMGIALVAFAPTAGVIAAGIISFRQGRRRLFAYSMIILIVYIMGFFVAR